MRIVKTVKSVPFVQGSGRYSELWEKVRATKTGEWLQIQCENIEELERITSASRQQGLKSSIQRKNLTLFLCNRVPGEL